VLGQIRRCSDVRLAVYALFGNRREDGAPDSSVGRRRRLGGGLEAAEVEVVLEDEGEPEDGCGQEEGVDAVEDAAVSGEHGSGVLDACSALDGGFKEVAQLGCDVQDRGEEEGLPDGLGDVEEEVAAGGEEIADPDDETGGEEASGDGGDGALPGLSGA